MHIPGEGGDSVVGSSVSGKSSQQESSEGSVMLAAYLGAPAESGSSLVKSICHQISSVTKGHMSPPGRFSEFCLGAKGALICHHFA